MLLVVTTKPSASLLLPVLRSLGPNFLLVHIFHYDFPAFLCFFKHRQLAIGKST